MDKVIAIFYAEYGKYISKFRMIPNQVDCLTPVYRRLLLSLHDIASKKLTKSAKITGYATGTYHPHGDCLDGNTLIYSLDNNLQTIKEVYDNNIKELDVLCLDTNDNQLKPGKARDFRIGQITDVVYEITFSDDSKQRVTDNHQFYITNKDDWCKAKDLEINDFCYSSQLYLNNKENCKELSPTHLLCVTNIKKIKLEKPIKMYDFTVDGYKNMMICTKNENNKVNLVCVHNSACYGALITLYKQGFVDVQGNFGSPGLDDASASAARYTEAKLKKWVEEFCFKYIDLVPWDEYEYEKEPLFLPSPIPIGLIGDGDIYMGIAFHRTIIPRYKISDLAKRLKYLMTEDPVDKVIIYPNLTRDGCTIQQNDIEAEKILKSGSGVLTIIPNGQIKKKELRIHGRVPQTTFTSLKDDPRVSSKCYSGSTIDVSVKPTKREDIQQFTNYVYKKHLIKNLNFIIYVCDDDGNVKQESVDNILLRCYEYYVEIVRIKLINECINHINKKFINQVILIIREILENNSKVKTIDEIIKIFNQMNYKIKTEEYDQDKDQFIMIEKIVSDEDIKNVCTTKSIRALIEHKINIKDNDTNISNIKVKINNNVNDCYYLICEFCNSKI